MNYFNRSNDEELGGISYCSNDSTSISNITSDKISSISLGNGTITINKYDKIIDILLKDIKQKFDNYMLELQGKVAFIGEPIFEVSTYIDKTKVKTVEYGDIRIEPLHLRFIKGEEF